MNGERTTPVLKEPLIKRAYYSVKVAIGEDSVRQKDLIGLLARELKENKTKVFYLVSYALTKPIQYEATKFYEPLLIPVPGYGIGTVSYRINPSWLDPQKIADATQLELRHFFELTARFY